MNIPKISLKWQFVSVGLILFVTGYSIASWHGSRAPASTANLTAVEQRLSKYGKMISKRSIPGGMTEWLLQTPSGQATLYTSQDGAAMISGAVWDLTTGQKFQSSSMAPSAGVETTASSNSIAAVAQSPATPSTGVTTKQPYAMEGPYTGGIHNEMKTIDGLVGVKEGKGGIADTVYIIIDPRCPYCQQTYNNTRQYVKNGATIKWIPAAALGDPATGNGLGAAMLKGGVDGLARILGKHEMVGVRPDAAQEKELARNFAFLLSAFEQSGGKQAGVPAAFYIDHRTGKSHMTTGVSEMVVLRDIFGY